MNDQLVFKELISNMKDEELIDSREYLTIVYSKLEAYVIDILKELNKKLV